MRTGSQGQAVLGSIHCVSRGLMRNGLHDLKNKINYRSLHDRIGTLFCSLHFILRDHCNKKFFLRVREFLLQKVDIILYSGAEKMA